MDGATIIARTLAQHEVRFLFTLCGGHISPILVACKQAGIRVVDVRDEATAVFAADAVARLTGGVGVAAVTAGPGVTNTTTAIQNATMAHSPVLLLGGATATMLAGKGALQDIDQIALMRPLVKSAVSTRTLRALGSAVEEALFRSRSGVPGPTFVECPVDLLYPEEVVASWYRKEAGNPLLRLYFSRHVRRIFAGAAPARAVRAVPVLEPHAADVRRTASWLRHAQRPVIVAGSETVALAREVAQVRTALETLGVPVFLAGMARGLMAPPSSPTSGGTIADSPLEFTEPLVIPPKTLNFRHQRREALRDADLVILAGMPFDFRIGYGRHISPRARVVTVGKKADALVRNRKPALAVQADPGRFLQDLGAWVTRQEPSSRKASESLRPYHSWLERLRTAEQARENEIAAQSCENAELSADGADGGDGVNPLLLCRHIDSQMSPDSVVVVDGGDFAAIASYVLRPRRPLSWLDPGVFGTLGVGGGFALAAGLCRPSAEVWLLYGDGAAAWSLAEFDTFVRHGVSVIAVVGLNASWAQIAREQVAVLHDAVGTTLRRTAYHLVAEGYGGRGLLIERPEDISSTLTEARRLASQKIPVLVNVHIRESSFRRGAISM